MWSFKKRCKISIKLCTNLFCVSFSNMKMILNNPGKDVYFKVIILTLFVYIVIKYFSFVSLCFHYN